MILNISGRTDIVAFYSEWLKNRLQEGFVDVRNPFYNKLVSRIYFKDVDAIIFCTKNPLPLLEYIHLIDKPLVIQITLTPYKNDIEPNVINKRMIIDAIKQLSNIIDNKFIYIRYDPIFISNKYNLEYHIRAFNKLCEELNGIVNKIIVSFLDPYKNVIKNKNRLQYQELDKIKIKELALSFSQIAKKYNMTIQTCSEEDTLEEYGFIKRDCVDQNLAFLLTGKTKFKTWKGRNNKFCHCVEMVDIGSYNTCSHFCRYCYANYDESQVLDNMSKHIKTSSLLIGTLNSDDVIKIRKN